MSRSSVRDPLEFYRQGQKIVLGAAGAKVGATAGWVVAAGANVSLMTLPASQSASTLVIPITGLKKGALITGFHLIGQIESAGGTVTLDASLRKQKAAAADITDSLVASMTQISVTADTAVNVGNSEKADLVENVDGDATYYLLITGTTAASTDVALAGAVVEYTER